MNKLAGVFFGYGRITTMNVKSIEKQEKCSARIICEIEKEAFEDAINKAYAKQKKSIQIPGFRKGHAPRKVVEGMYGSNVFHDDAVELISQQTLADALKSEMCKDLNVYGNPAIQDYTVEDGVATIIYTIDLYPEVTLGAYKGLKLVKDDTTVSDAEVEDDIKSMAKRNARVQTADRPAQSGDTVVIDFEGFLDGTAFEGGKGENYSLELGSGSFIPGFEDQLIGVRAGEDKDVEVTFPENYQAAELAGKPAVFKCKVHEVKETLLPELDDEFAKDVSEFDTLDELRASLREKKETYKKEQAEANLKNRAVSQAAANAQFVIPESMYQDQIESYLQSYEYQLAANGMTLQDYLGMMGMDENALRMGLRTNAEKEVKNNLVLEAIAKDAALDATDEEIEAEYAVMADENDMELEKVKSYVQADSVRNTIKNTKAVQLIIDNAEFTSAAEVAQEVKTEMEKMNAENRAEV